MYVNDELSGTFFITCDSTENVIKGVNVGPYPVADLLDPMNGYIYVFNFISASAGRINSNSQTVISTIRVGYRAHEEAPDTYTGFVLVSFML
jgi:DNA-binding beta-propeller fold protein YncE